MQRIRQRGVEVYTMSHIPDKERNRGTTKQIVESASDQEWQAVVEVSRSTRTLNWELYGGLEAVMPRPHAVVTLLPRDTRARKRKRTGRRRAWRQPPQKPAAAFERAARRARAIRMTASLSLRFCFSCELSKVFLLRRMRRWPTALDALRKRRSAFSILSVRTRVQKARVSINHKNGTAWVPQVPRVLMPTRMCQRWHARRRACSEASAHVHCSLTSHSARARAGFRGAAVAYGSPCSSSISTRTT